MSNKNRVEKLETGSGANAPYIIILHPGLAKAEAMAAYLAKTGRPPPRPRDLVIVIEKPGGLQRSALMACLADTMQAMYLSMPSPCWAIRAF
jgi:hypothetical protein